MDKIAYVHPTYTIKGVDVITPQALDALLAQGWTVQSREKETFGGKQVTVVHLHQEESRGVSVRRPGYDIGKEPQDRGLSTVRDERAVSAPRGNRSYMGESEMMHLEGVRVTNSMRTENTYAQGCDAAYAGKDASECPFTEPHARVQWLKGHAAGSKARKAGGAAGGSTEDAFLLGKLSAQGDRDAEVMAPYPSGTPHYKRWIEGFRAGGGRVE